MDKQVKAIKLSGYGGLLPFIMTLAGLYLTSGAIKEFFLDAFIAYSAVILSFIGAVHWGFILKAEAFDRAAKLLAFAVIPSLIGWTALLCPPLFALIFFALAFPGLFIYERFTELSELLPSWYMMLRVQLTMLVTSMQVVAIGGSL
jgi:hypothetical protein